VAFVRGYLSRQQALLLGHSLRSLAFQSNLSVLDGEKGEEQGGVPTS
jgi:hypothetical protein